LLHHKEGGALSEEDEDIVKLVAAGLYAGDADTVISPPCRESTVTEAPQIASALTTFMWLMAIYPEVQKRAQEEIETSYRIAVTGTGESSHT
jgi:hypothetical protein